MGHAWDELEWYFDYNVFPSKRLIYLGSHSADDDGKESGVDYQMFQGFLKGITYLDAVAEKPITIHMNIDGGDWYHGRAIYSAIQACRSHVTIVAWGYACSMGALILQAADHRLIAKDCVFMIHDGDTVASGSPRTIEAWGVESKRQRKALYQVYLDRMIVADPSMTMLKIERLCGHDRIYTPDQTVLMGFADAVLQNFVQVVDA